MSRFVSDYSGYSKSVVEGVDVAIGLANAVTSHKGFYERIAAKTEPFDAKFTDKEVTPAALAEILYSSPVIVNVKIKKAWRRVLGWTYLGKPENVYLNVRRLDRPVSEIASTLIHEWVHAVDATHPLSFHHGNNKPAGKGNSAPYWIDKLAGEIIQEMLSSLQLTEAVVPEEDGVFYERITQQELDSLEQTSMDTSSVAIV